MSKYACPDCTKVQDQFYIFNRDSKEDGYLRATCVVGGHFEDVNVKRWVRDD